MKPKWVSQLLETKNNQPIDRVGVTVALGDVVKTDPDNGYPHSIKYGKVTVVGTDLGPNYIRVKMYLADGNAIVAPYEEEWPSYIFEVQR